MTYLDDHIQMFYLHLCDDVCVDDANVFGCLAYVLQRIQYEHDVLKSTIDQKKNFFFRIKAH